MIIENVGYFFALISRNEAFQILGTFPPPPIFDSDLLIADLRARRDSNSGPLAEER